MNYSATFIFCVFAVLSSLTESEANRDRSRRAAALDRLVRLQPRVIGGTEIRNRCTPPFNYIVALQVESSVGLVTYCSGVLVDTWHVLTSGSCASNLMDLQDLKITVVVGELDMYMTDFSEQRADIDSFKIHPNFNVSTLDNNIALIRLKKNVTLNNCVAIAPRMEEDSNACTDVDKSCMFMGFGPYVESKDPVNSRLPRYASATCYNDLVTTLWSRFQTGADPPVGTIYGEGINPNQKACLFDWGGPFVCLRNGKYVCRGLIADHNCLVESSFPILVTDVPKYYGWIDQRIAVWSI